MIDKFQFEFMLGVNYWPRRHGVKMWKNFSVAEIEEDFAKIQALGMNTVRVFPLWDDFQPLCEFPGCGNNPQNIGMRDNWNITPVQNPEMMNIEMFERFDQVVTLAKKNNLKLIVALLTAWMSGILFNPSFRNGRNLFSHPFMLKYQMLYCRAFASRYSNTTEIIAWEYGNEQNCVDSCDSPETAWVWLHALAAELRLNDPATPIASGMHGLVNCPNSQLPWGIDDQASAVDLLTTHPYPAFTPGCFLESPTDLRANLHATAESRYLSDLGVRPVLCEETGSLGNSVLSEPLCASYLKMRLYSLFANNIAGCLWWCYGDFNCKNDLPYRTTQMENDGLGIIRVNGEVKPVGEEFANFAKISQLFGGKMAELSRVTAIIVSDQTNDWPSLFNSFVLCTQAGLTPKFVRPDRDDLSHYKLLIAPSFSGYAPISSTAWEQVTKAVKNGAVLYVSGNGVSLNNMAELFGIKEMEKVPLSTIGDEISFNNFKCSIKSQYRNVFHRYESSPTAFYSDGTPAMVQHRYGKGIAIYLSMPLESSYAKTPHVYSNGAGWKLYSHLRELANIKTIADYPNNKCERFFNSDSPNHGYLTIINHSRKYVEEDLQFTNPISNIKIIAGNGDLNGHHLKINALDALILEINY